MGEVNEATVTFCETLRKQRSGCSVTPGPLRGLIQMLSVVQRLDSKHCNPEASPRAQVGPEATELPTSQRHNLGSAGEYLSSREPDEQREEGLSCVFWT